MIDLHTVIVTLYIFGGAIIGLIFITLIKRWLLNAHYTKALRMADFILYDFQDFPSDKKVKNIDLFLKQYTEIRDNTHIPKDLEQKVNAHLKKSGQIDLQKKKIYSKSKLKRIKGAFYLGFINTQQSKAILEHAIYREKDYLVKLYIVYGLTKIQNPSSIRSIVQTLYNAPGWYQEKIQELLTQFGEHFHTYLPEIKGKETNEIKFLIIHFASKYFTLDLKEYLIERTRDKNKTVALHALRVLANNYPHALRHDHYLNHSDPEYRNIAIGAMSVFPTKEMLDVLMKKLEDKDSAPVANQTIAKILRVSPQYIEHVLDKFHDTPPNSSLRKNYADTLSHILEYFLVRLLDWEKKYIKLLIREIILNGNTNEIIGFLNRNRDEKIESEILTVIENIIKTHDSIKEEFQLYLNERILYKLGLEKKTPIKSPERFYLHEKMKVNNLRIILTAFLGFFITVFFIRHYPEIGFASWNTLVKSYIIDFNYYLIFYLIALHSIYLGLSVFSIFGFRKNKILSKLKPNSFLFNPRTLPSISIISPANNEESNIIETVNSLLNLRYPDYELFIINDGSNDGTLNKLISYFQLERVTYKNNEKLKTQPIRGIYRNENIPKLIVVDKSKGGKADALNAGINLATKDFICGTDADSLIEESALLRMAAVTLNTDKESVAIGGNILPVNACYIDLGKIDTFHMPKNHLARFQMIEYLRAFMAGRIGWSYLNSLLIISGAFGLFKKDRITEIGGYLAKAERYKKDTVAEDMELVVRLSSDLHRKNVHHKIHYAEDACGWTEVPEKWKSFYRQRIRWQRGLIDILTFHKKTCFDPKHRRMGLIGIPYYYIFEMIGPLIETKGYIMIILAAVLGLLNLKLALLLSIALFLFGIIISLSAFILTSDQCLTSKNCQRLNCKEFFTLLFYSIIENFGFRQVTSLIRTLGFFSSMSYSKGWGIMERKGYELTNHKQGKIVKNFT